MVVVADLLEDLGGAQDLEAERLLPSREQRASLSPAREVSVW